MRQLPLEILGLVYKKPFWIFWAFGDSRINLQKAFFDILSLPDKIGVFILPCNLAQGLLIWSVFKKINIVFQWCFRKKFMCVTHCHRNLIFQVFLFVLCLFLYKVGFERKCVKLLVASKGNVLLVLKGNVKLASKG